MSYKLQITPHFAPPNSSVLIEPTQYIISHISQGLPAF